MYISNNVNFPFHVPEMSSQITLSLFSFMYFTCVSLTLMRTLAKMIRLVFFSYNT